MAVVKEAAAPPDLLRQSAIGCGSQTETAADYDILLTKRGPDEAVSALKS